LLWIGFQVNTADVRWTYEGTEQREQDWQSRCPPIGGTSTGFQKTLGKND
jgi:hypothetical protein